MYPERQKRQKTRFVCNFNGKSVFPSYLVRYYATPRHNPRSDFYKNGLKSSARLEGKKSRSFSAKSCVITLGPIFIKMVLNRAQGLKEKSQEVSARKNNNRQRYNKKCRRGGGFHPPPGSFRVKDSLDIQLF